MTASDSDNVTTAFLEMGGNKKQYSAITEH